jgi:hypothetical protein
LAVLGDMRPDPYFTEAQKLGVESMEVYGNFLRGKRVC